MNNLNKLMLFVGWLIVGVALSYTILYMGVFIIDSSVINGLIMVIIPLLLFSLLDRHNKLLMNKKKAVSHYFTKNVACIFIGCMISYIRLFITDDSFAIFVAIIIFLALLLMLIDMRIIQLIYKSTLNNRIYFAYILLGGVLAINISYIVKLFAFRGFEDIFYVVAYVLLVVLSVILIIRDYKKVYIKQKDTIKTSNKQYIKNAIKLTSVPFLLFIIPLTIVFVCLH